MAVSNALGSNSFNIYIGLGLPWLIYTAIIGPYHSLPADDIVGPVLVLVVTLLGFLVLLACTGFKLAEKLDKGKRRYCILRRHMDTVRKMVAGATRHVWNVSCIRFAISFSICTSGHCQPGGKSETPVTSRLVAIASPRGTERIAETAAMTRSRWIGAPSIRWSR